jgi:polyisoprenyl-teichoic acid--peptidoglycan teichoic acid transferase
MLKDLLTRFRSPLRWSPRTVRVVVMLNVLVLLAAAAPFALWGAFGPERFNEVQLSEVPGGWRGPVDHIDPMEFADGATREGNHLDGLPFDLSPSTRVTLVFTTGSRDMTAEEARRLHITDFRNRGSDGLTDSMMLLIADRETGAVAMLSIPRDLWLFDRGHRINATLNRHGLQAFVDDVSRVSGLPIHHLVKVNFAAFADLVDGIGGVAVHVNRPLADHNSRLFIPDAGCWRLDGFAALAWTRSRFTMTRNASGAWVMDRTASDFGRIDRQQQLIRSAWDRIRTPSIISKAPELITAARRGLMVDDGVGVQDVRDLLSAFRNVPAGRFEGHTIPTRGQRIGAAAAQVMDVQATRELLTRLRTWPPEDAAGAQSVHAPATWAGTVLAAGPTLASGDTCTLASARELPNAVQALREVPRPRRHAGGSNDSGTTGGDPPDQQPTEEPTDEPTEEPTDEPTEDPTEDDEEGGLLPLPLPGNG